MEELITELSIDKKLAILTDAAKYDVACTSSGVNRRGVKGKLGNSLAPGVCHAFSADGRCISLLKILLTNHCTFDCKYCKNRISNDIERATFTPEEICTLTIEFYKRNYIEGLFLSSGVLKSPNYTMERIVETLRLLRGKYAFNGYIHVKAIPGASSELLYSAGLLADRMSLNMEMPTQESLKKVAPNKSMYSIITPMNSISNAISGHRLAIGKSAKMERASINKQLVKSIFDTNKPNQQIETDSDNQVNSIVTKIQNTSEQFMYPADIKDVKMMRPFAPAGQSTQMIIGASEETDLQLIKTTQALYQSFDLKRVFYSAYIPINEDEALPEIDTPVPLLREHRLYQADWLLRYYGFNADEILTKANPFFDYQIDPKCNWALRHLELFPIEITTATADELLRIPGIGPLSVKKILKARKYGRITFDMLKKMRVVLKRAQYFITCGGKMLNHIPLEEKFITRCLTSVSQKEVYDIEASYNGYKQLNLLDDFNITTY